MNRSRKILRTISRFVSILISPIRRFFMPSFEEWLKRTEWDIITIKKRLVFLVELEDLLENQTKDGKFKGG